MPKGLLRSLTSLLAILLDWGWRLSFLVWQLSRVSLRASGITITVLAAVIPPLAIAFWPDWKPMVAAFFLSLPVSGVIALLTADPQTYARLLLAGRSATAVLFVISWHALRACKRTLRKTRKIQGLARSLEEGMETGRWNLPEDMRESIGKRRKRLRGFIQREHSRLLRIEAMKVLASDELDIPQRRLCDHVIQYSPAMHRDRLQKFLGAWGEIMNFPPPESEEDIQRFRGLLHHNRSFLENVRHRIGYQRQTLKNRDLHPFIVQFASMHSTSGSLHTYAEALRFLVTERSLGQSTEDIVDRLRFVHRKQRAHPGFDLHALLLRTLGCMRGLEGIDREDVGSLENVLRALDRMASVSSSKVDVPLLCHYLSYEGGLKAFLGLPANLSRLVSSQHGKICADFKGLCEDWFRDVPTSSRYILSHGYSRTVLSVLRSTLAPLDDRTPRVFFVLPDEKASLDTRIMEYEIKAQEELRPFRNFAAGTEHHLLGLLSPGDFVLVLLGAECFDTKNRVVHPRGPVQGLGGLLRQLRRRKIRYLVIVVAEAYKLHTDELTSDTNFYGQHFDRIELYSPEWIDLILTDDPSWPADGKSIVARRRAQAGVPSLQGPF